MEVDGGGTACLISGLFTGVVGFDCVLHRVDVVDLLLCFPVCCGFIAGCLRFVFLDLYCVG